jgi:hypothetical protein
MLYVAGIHPNTYFLGNAILSWFLILLLHVMKNEMISVTGIHPDTHSPGMFSWFPILFPIKVRRNSESGKKFSV